MNRIRTVDDLVAQFDDIHHWLEFCDDTDSALKVGGRLCHLLSVSDVVLDSGHCRGELEQARHRTLQLFIAKTFSKGSEMSGASRSCPSLPRNPNRQTMARFSLQRGGASGKEMLRNTR